MTVGNTYKYIYKKNCENPTGHPYGGAEYRWGINFVIFFTNIWLYVGNDTR